MSDEPKTKFAAVLVAAQEASDIRRTLATLRRQTIVKEIELLLVGPNTSIFDALSAEETAGFGRVETLSWGGPIKNVDASAIVGIRAARSPVLSIVEDHVYLEPTWVQDIVDVHEQHDNVVGVGCQIVLANHPTALPIANHLFALASYTAPLQEGPVERVSRHQVAYKLHWLKSVDEDLESLLPRGGGMVERAAKEGGLYMAANVRIHHLACADWSESLAVRMASGRLNGSTTKNRDGFIARIKATLRTPQIAWWRIRSQVKKYPTLGLRIVTVAMAASLLLTAECLGYLRGIWFGPGQSYDLICRHEYRRERGVRPSDTQRLNTHWKI